MLIAYAMLLAILPTSDKIEITAPTEPVPVGVMVELTIKTEFPYTAVQAIGRQHFDTVKVYQTIDPELWVLTGPEDEYLITVTASGPDGIAQESIKILIGPRPPPPVPDPDGPKSTTVVIAEEGEIPLHAEGAVKTLREQGETVFFVRAGATTVEGIPPAFLEKQLAAAREVGIPALIVCQGDTIVKQMRLPSTREQIIAEVEAVE